METGDQNIRQSLLWFSLLGAAVAWFVRFVVVWAVSEFGCMDSAEGFLGFDGPMIPLTVATLPFLALAVAALVVSWRLYRRQDVRERSDLFMIKAGLITNAIFVLIIIVETVPVFTFLDICRFSSGF